MSRSIAYLFALSVLFFTPACDSTDSDLDALDYAQGEFGFVGSLAGTDALVGVLVTDTEAFVYACSSDDEIYEWFSAPVGDRLRFDLTNGAGASVSGQFGDGSFSGTITLRDGATHAFDAMPAGAGEGGLYRIKDAAATAAGVEGGWVVSATGVERGAFRIQTVFRKAPARPRPTDGTSNTILIGEVVVSFSRLSRG